MSKPQNIKFTPMQNQEKQHILTEPGNISFLAFLHEKMTQTINCVDQIIDELFTMFASYMLLFMISFAHTD